jgi:hypothetical protein
MRARAAEKGDAQCRSMCVMLDTGTYTSVRSADLVRLTVSCMDRKTSVILLLRNGERRGMNETAAEAEIMMDWEALSRMLRPGMSVLFSSSGRLTSFTLEAMAEKPLFAGSEPLQETILKCLMTN